MKQFVLFIGFLVLCVDAQNYSYIVDSPADKIKDNPGKCYEENVGIIDKGAEIKVDGKCKVVECLDGGKVKLITCHPLIVEPPCYAVYPDKPFPECCTFRVECLEPVGTPVPPPRRNL